MSGRSIPLVVIAAGVLALSAPARTQAASPPAGVSGAQMTSAYWQQLLEAETQLKADPGSLRTGARYRQLIIQGGLYDRAIALLRTLVDQHPQSVEAHMNLALACVDKVPVSGKIRQALLGREAIEHFTTSIKIRPTSVALYCRGLVNLFYDVLIFRRVAIGVADLEHARELHLQKAPRPYHARVYVSLGDGYWKLKNLARAKAVWSDGLARFPGNADLQARVAKTGKELEWMVRTALDPDNRVDTSLQEILYDLAELGLR